MKPVRTFEVGLLGAAALVALALGCGGRAGTWPAGVGGARAFGLEGAVVIVDPPADRAVALEVGSDGALASTRLPTGHGVVATAVDQDGRHLYILSAGH